MAAYGFHDQHRLYRTPVPNGYTQNPNYHSHYGERDRRRQYPDERRAERHVEYDISGQDDWSATVRVLEEVVNSFRDDDMKRSRRCESVTPQYHAPRRDSYDHLTRSSTRPNRGVCRDPSVNRQQTRTYQPTQAFVPPQRTATAPFPRWTKQAPDPVPVLNPHLEQHQPGVEPIIFSITRGLSSVAYNLANSLAGITIPWGAADFNLPATVPSVTDMTITVVVDDPLPPFQWPIVVHNPQGITCGDVLHAVSSAFHEPVPRWEYAGWRDRIKYNMNRAFFRRTEGSKREKMRRIDYMSGRVADGKGITFRGMLPAIDASGGWLLFVGPD